MLATFVGLVDRQIPNYLVAPIRASMAISDTRMSFIQGTSFALIFGLVGLPMGAFVDRYNRRNLITAGMLIWSASTIFCGFASTFGELFIGRFGVGIGEAALAPAAYSLISDYFKPQVRGRVLAIYFLASSVSSGLAITLIGFFIGVAPGLSQSFSLLSALEPWQIAFVLSGIPGLLIVPVLLSIREVERRGNDGLVVAHKGDGATFRDFYIYLASRQNRKLFLCLYGAIACLQFCNFASYAWVPSLFIRKFGMTPEDIAMLLGVTIAIGGGTGTALSAVFADRWARRDFGGGRLMLLTLPLILVVPLHLTWPIMDNKTISLVLYGLVSVCHAFGYASSPVIIQDVVPNRMRGKAIAIYMVIVAVAGYSLGATTIALITDYVFGSDKALPYSLVISLAPVALCGVVLLLLGQKRFCRVRDALA